MPILVVFSTLIQLLLILHAIKTGRRDPWLWVILFFPGIGSALYVFFELLPELRRTREGRAVASKILKAVDPHRDLKRLTAELARSDNIENKINLAKECIGAGMYAEAIELYQNSLKGIYLTEPNIMLGLATAQFYQARVGCINAVSCTKMFKFTMVYDASLIHPTLAVGSLKKYKTAFRFPPSFSTVHCHSS